MSGMASITVQLVSTTVQPVTTVLREMVVRPVVRSPGLIVQIARAPIARRRAVRRPSVRRPTASIPTVRTLHVPVPKDIVLKVRRARTVGQGAPVRMIAGSSPRLAMIQRFAEDLVVPKSRIASSSAGMRLTLSRSAMRRRPPVPTASGTARQRPSCRVSFDRMVPRALVDLVRTNTGGDPVRVRQGLPAVQRATGTGAASAGRRRAEVQVSPAVRVVGIGIRIPMTREATGAISYSLD
jgi:hypothetical protein